MQNVYLRYERRGPGPPEGPVTLSSSPRVRSRTKRPTPEAKRRPAPAAAAEEPRAAEGHEVQIGPPKLTRFERARIIGARALQLALGAPPFVPLSADIRDPIGLAIRELEAKALPISIRRTLPDGRHQDIPLDWLLQDT
jgi:DNA-directed RNA polymerase subunit K/omega